MLTKKAIGTPSDLAKELFESPWGCCHALAAVLGLALLCTPFLPLPVPCLTGLSTMHRHVVPVIAHPFSTRGLFVHSDSTLPPA